MRRGLKRTDGTGRLRRDWASFKPIPDEEGTETMHPGRLAIGIDDTGLQTDPR